MVTVKDLQDPDQSDMDAGRIYHASLMGPEIHKPGPGKNTVKPSQITKKTKGDVPITPLMGLYTRFKHFRINGVPIEGGAGLLVLSQQKFLHINLNFTLSF